MRPAIDAVRATGTAVAEVALCYTGDLSDPDEQLYTLDYYLRLAEQIVDAGAHVMAIKDMAGLLRPPAARRLVTALRERFDLPVHLHTHDTAGGQLATLISGDRGRGGRGRRGRRVDGRHHQPAVAVRAGRRHRPHDRATGLALQAVCDLEPYWEAVRKVYAPFESGLASPTGRVYHHEIPGGQLSNLRQQAIALGLGERFELIEDYYAAADRMLGRLVKVTPSSKVVGDLALHLVGRRGRPEGVRGRPGGVRRPRLGDRVPARRAGRPARRLARAVPHARAGRAARAEGRHRSCPPRTAPACGRRRRDPAATLNRLLFPGPTKEFDEHRDAYGDTSVLSTKDFFYGLEPEIEHIVDLEPGVPLLIELGGDLRAGRARDAHGLTTLNGQLRPVSVRDESVATDVKTAEKADRTNPGHVAAPFAGVVTLAVESGATVEQGQTVATIEAMKMEAAITAPRAGTVARLAIGPVQQVEGGDLLLVLE